MAGPSRIDELRKKFDENPRRYFAPLANEYRKLGDFDQAIFICQEFLPQQPGHMSGHIVYGQALFEAGRHVESRGVFETALSLDPENLIALRHLGDIARAEGDIETARAWYKRVLESDPRNEEIGGLLQALDSDEVAPPPPVAPPVAPPAAPEAVVAAPAPVAEAPAPAPARPAEPIPSSSLPTPVVAVTPVEPAVFDVPDAAAPAAPAVEPVEEEPIESARPGSHLADVAAMFNEARAEFSGTPSPSVPLDIERETPPLSAPTTTPPSIPGFEAHNHVSEVDEGASRGSAARRSPFDELEAERTAPFSPESFDAFDVAAPTPTPAESQSPPIPFLDVDEPAPPRAATRPPIEDEAGVPSSAATPTDAFVTETMAELYLRQGHREAALGVYRQLIERRPTDAALRARLNEILAAERTEGARVDVPSDEAAGVEGDDATSGPTIREFLGALAVYRPGLAAAAAMASTNGGEPPMEEPAAVPQVADPVEEPVPASKPRGEPTRAHASVGGSLDTLFTEAESARKTRPSSEREPIKIESEQQVPRAAAPPVSPSPKEEGEKLPGRPAKPASTELSLDHVFRHATPVSATPVQAPTFSFDQFFSQQAQQDATGSDAEPSREPNVGETDDIQQFNAWLEGLKKS